MKKLSLKNLSDTEIQILICAIMGIIGLIVILFLAK